MSGTLEKVARQAFKAPLTIRQENDKGECFEAQLNPSSFSRNYSISYSNECNGEPPPVGQPAPAPKFRFVNPEDLSFELLLDGTGVANLSPVPKSVHTQLSELRKVTYNYQGEHHEPPIVRITWGALDSKGFDQFVGRLSSLKVDYTLFKPSGSPLRAKVALAFVSYKPPLQVAQENQLCSPDMSRLVRVRSGDTLPALCEQVYQDSSQYLAVARANKLRNFRRLVTGTQLYFPPVVPS